MGEWKKMTCACKDYIQPTREAVELAEEAYMSFGDMETAVSVAFTAVNFRLAKEVARRGALLTECLEFISKLKMGRVSPDEMNRLSDRLEGL